MINKNQHNSLARGKGNDILIWSWNNLGVNISESLSYQLHTMDIIIKLEVIQVKHQNQYSDILNPPKNYNHIKQAKH